jgi:transposase
MAEAETPVGEDVQLLNDFIELVFIANVKAIAKDQKRETLLKMIQSCKEIQPADSSNQELWATVQKVRREVMGGKPPDKPVKPSSTKRRKVQP